MDYSLYFYHLPSPTTSHDGIPPVSASPASPPQMALPAESHSSRHSSRGSRDSDHEAIVIGVELGLAVELTYHNNTMGCIDYNMYR